MINKNTPQINFVFDRRKVASLSNKGSLEIRICHNYKQKFISTGIKLYSNQWKKGKIMNCPDILQISQILDKQITEIRAIILDMLAGGNLDINNIPQILLNKNTDKPTFIDFCKQRSEVRKYRKAADSQERYDRFIKRFELWGKIKYFEDITESNIIMYDKYLNSKGMKPYSKWNNYHRFLNSFILDAIEAGHINKNPYRWVNIDKDKSKTGIGKYLSPEEFQILKKTNMPTKCLEKVKDLFIFQTYTCLSYADLKSFNYKDIKNIKGVKVYTGNRLKTNQQFTIPILPQALEILYKYNNVLPIISNVKYNEYLKVVAMIANINKPLSSHWARHTGATLLLNQGVNMRIISKVCGHSSTKITEQIYAKLLDETVVEAFSKIVI